MNDITQADPAAMAQASTGEQMGGAPQPGQMEAQAPMSAEQKMLGAEMASRALADRAMQLLKFAYARLPQGHEMGSHLLSALKTLDTGLHKKESSSDVPDVLKKIMAAHAASRLGANAPPEGGI